MPANHARKSAIRRRMEATGENYRQAAKAVAHEEFMQTIGWVCPSGEPQDHAGWDDCRPSCPEYGSTPRGRRAPQVDPEPCAEDCGCGQCNYDEPLGECPTCAWVGTALDFHAPFGCGGPRAECPYLVSPRPFL